VSVADLDLLNAGPWAAAVLVAIPTIYRIVITIIALHGTKPAERSAILLAIADLFAATTRRRSEPVSRKTPPSRLDGHDGQAGDVPDHPHPKD
jgi:hypothetical protein